MVSRKDLDYVANPDSDAFPVHAAWYANRVAAAMGSETKDSYRLWYTDYADLSAQQAGQTTRLVGYMPVFNQAGSCPNSIGGW